MALLRNREVIVIGPNGTVASPIFTVQHTDGSREDTQLKYIHMSETEHKEWAKANPTVADQVKVIPDKRVQEILDHQSPEKIRKTQKPSDTPVQVPTLVKPSDVAKA